MTRIYIVDDHSVVIEGVLSLLQNVANIFVIGHTNNAANCLQFMEKNQVDVLLLDINLPDESGLDLCKKLKTLYPAIKILALTSFNQISYVHKMIANGANGYLLKNISKDELVQAIETTVAGQSFFSDEITELLKIAKDKSPNTALTKRETDILKLVVEGLTNPQIGEKLFISTDTVDSHRKNLHTKLGVNNTALLVRYALENGLV